MVKAEMTSEDGAITLGKPLFVSVTLTPQAGWHTYYRDPGDAGVATSIQWKLPEGFNAGEIQWPKPKRFDEAGLTTYGYDGQEKFPIIITTPAAIADDTLAIGAHVTWLACKDICIPESADVSLTLPVVHSANPQHSSTAATLDAPRNKEFETSLPLILLFAFLGGLILNIMPCVLPVLALKVLALVKKSTSEPHEIRAQGLAYAAGVLTCFLALSLVILVLQESGNVLGWGFQLQSPLFVLILAYVMFIIGLGQTRLYSLPVLFGNIQPANSYMTGLLAALVATPCTVPFMAGAVGYALTAPPLVTILIFLVMGLGLSAPFLLFSFVPRAARLLPRPGPWMMWIKNLVPLFLFASAAWLLWVASAQIDRRSLSLAVLTLAAITTLLSLRIQGWVKCIGIVVCCLSLYFISPMTKEAAMNAYSPTRLASERAKGKPVFVDATADWCLTCKLNERTTLHTQKVRKAFCDRGVVYLVADWTNKDPEITTLLQQFGRRGVPAYIYYPSKGEPFLLPQILTPDSVIEALDREQDSSYSPKCD